MVGPFSLFVGDITLGKGNKAQKGMVQGAHQDESKMMVPACYSMRNLQLNYTVMAIEQLKRKRPNDKLGNCNPPP